MTINLRDTFSCPFSTKEPYPIIHEAVRDSCGHTFEKKNIEIYVKKYRECPLSRRPLTNQDLKPYQLFQRAIDTLNHHPELLRTNNLDGLDDESRELVEEASKQVTSQRAIDQLAGTPIRVPADMLDRIAEAMKEASVASKEFYASSS